MHAVQLLDRLKASMFDGPAKSAGAAVRTAAALLPPAEQLPALQELADAVCSRLQNADTSGTPQAVTVIHAVCELLRVCPSKVEHIAPELVAFVQQQLFPDGTAQMAIAHSPAFAPAQSATLPAVALPDEAHAKAATLLLLTQSLLHAHRIAISRDRSQIAAAMELLLDLLHDVAECMSEDDSERMELLRSTIEGDISMQPSPAGGHDALVAADALISRVKEDEGLLRGAGASGLLRIASKLPDALSLQAYITLSATVQDPLQSVRFQLCQCLLGAVCLW